MNSNLNNQTYSSVIQHIESEPHPYRVPVFKLEPSNIQFSGQTSKKAKMVRLVSCDFSTNYYNISFNNNCLRWLRKVRLGLNEKVVEEFPNNINPVNPYFDGSSPVEEWHLCSLYINPSQYPDVNSIINELNNDFNESIKNLFDITTSTEHAYSGVSLNYDNYIFNPSGVIRLDDTLMNEASLSSSDYIPYVIDGDIIYTHNGRSYSQHNAVMYVKDINGATLGNTVILNPKFQLNQFTEYETGGEWYVHTSELSSMTTDGTDNILREANLMNTECSIDLFTNRAGTIQDNFDIRNEQYYPLKSSYVVMVNKASLKSFPDYIGLSKDEERREYGLMFS